MPYSETREKRDVRHRAEMKGHNMSSFKIVDEGGGYLTNLFCATCRDCNMELFISCSIPGTGRFCDDEGGQECGLALSDYCPVNDPKRAALNGILKVGRGAISKQQRCFEDRCIATEQ